MAKWTLPISGFLLVAVFLTETHAYCVHSSTNSKLGYDPHGILKPEAIPIKDPIYVIVKNIVDIFYARGIEDAVDALSGNEKESNWKSKNPKTLKSAKTAIRKLFRG